MAGRGPRPKNPERRVRTNSNGLAGIALRFELGSAPELPEDIPWPDQTRAWWDVWVSSPHAEHFTQITWETLLTTALIHADVWAGNLDRAPELRLREAKYGATPEDMARLRMTMAEADEADSKRPEKSAQSRYGATRLAPVEPISKARAKTS